MSTLQIAEDTDFRSGGLIPLIDRIEFVNGESITAVFKSSDFHAIFPVGFIFDNVTIDASPLVGETHSIVVHLSGETSFSATAWNFSSSAPDVVLFGADTNDTLTGSSVGDIIFGGLGADTLNGGGGNDVLRGESGTDTLNGGGNNDVLVGGNFGDALFGGSGSDTASYVDAPGGGVGGLEGVTVVMRNMALNTNHAAFDTFNSIENIDGSQFKDFLAGDNNANIIQGFGGNDTLFGQGGDDTLNGNAGNDTLNGQADDDTLVGGDGEDTLFGGSGNDDLFGGNDADVLNGGLGADFLNGGGNTDAASYASAASAGGGVGVSVFMSTPGLNTGEAVGDSYFSVENLTGSSFDDVLGGTAVANRILGGGGNDTLLGGLGADTLNGESGSDTASYANAANGLLASLATPALNGGEAAGDIYILIENLAGSAHADILGGNGLANTISGGNGDDTLAGLGGNDTLNGGLNNDLLDGGDNVDTLNGGDGDDTLIGGAGADILNGGAGIDQFRFLSGSEVVQDESINGGAELFLGFDGLVLVNTGVINFGLATLIDIEVLNFLSGASTAIFNANQIGTSAIGLVGGNVSVLDTIIVNGAGISLAGVGFQNWETGDVIALNGTAAADTITGSSQNDTIAGGAGGDTLNGGAGLGDTLIYATSNAGVIIDLQTGEASGGHAAGDVISNFENAVGSNHADNLTGSSGNNLLNGGADVDSLNGGLGDDTLIGGTGGDTLNGGSGLHDVADYGLSNAAVTVNIGGVPSASGGHATGDSLAGIEDLTGSDFADTLAGNIGQNILQGGDGGDTLSSSNNNDQVFGGNGDDLLLGGAGADIIDGGNDIDTVSFTNAAARIILTLNNGAGTATGSGQGTGDVITGVENITGSAFNDIFTGDANANTILGGAGNDTLNGGGGDDTINGQSGLDTINGGAGDDSLTGSIDADTFVYSISALWDDDQIIGWQNGTDRIDLVDAGFDFADFTESQAGADTLLTLTANPAQTIRLIGINASSIDAADFV